MTCDDPVKCSTPPPGYRSPTERPCNEPLDTPTEARAVARLSYAPQASVELGDPILAHAFRYGDHDLWLVPVLDGRGAARWVVGVDVKADGRGCFGLGSEWAGPFPAISAASAESRVRTPDDPVLFTEAVIFPWTNVLPPSSETGSVWRIVQASGRESFLFGNGELCDGHWIRALLAYYFPTATWRGEAPNATPRPSPAMPAGPRPCRT